MNEVQAVKQARSKHEGIQYALDSLDTAAQNLLALKLMILGDSMETEPEVELPILALNKFLENTEDKIHSITGLISRTTDEIRELLY